MNQQDLDVYAGENRTLTLYARDPSNNVQNLTGQAVIWRVGKPPRMPSQRAAVIEKDGTVVDAANGIFTVSVEPGDTWLMGGNYVHVALIVKDGTIQFVSDTDQDIDFVNDDGDPVIFVSDDDGFVTVVTVGVLRIRRNIQVIQ